ncbi:MAG: D-2-hydroxyacid dehydrogenase [Saprospiraceae bacterium]|nr:D-2-hydroxyacid dehydrogenase [Saprospiraceae bacterium]
MMSLQPKMVILDGFTINPGDLNFGPLEALGALKIFKQSRPDEVVERCYGYDTVIINKVRMTREIIQQLPDLRLICLFATGYDNVDLTAAKDHGVAVYNAKGYGSESVAQHVLAFLLHYGNRVADNAKSVNAGAWSKQEHFSYSIHTVTELKGKHLGIIGYGKIGQRVAEMAHAFGMHILVVDRGRDVHDYCKRMSLEALVSKADFVSLHAPLSEATHHLINQERLDLMQRHAVLINTGRGALIDEHALANALRSRQIAAAYLDVLHQEPPPQNHPLMGLDNCVITPHMAWRALEARQRLIEITRDNIESMREGQPSNNRLV